MIKKQNHTRSICLGDKKTSPDLFTKGKYVCKKTLLSEGMSSKRKKAYLEFLDRQAEINALLLKRTYTN